MLAPSSYIPRAQRPDAWGKTVYRRAIANGARAIEAGISAIEAVNGSAFLINSQKLAVERAMQRGAAAPRTRCDYGKVALLCPSSVDGAMRAIERAYRSEIRNRQQRQRNGFPLPHPDVEQKLQQARIFLRWYRRFGDQSRFAGLVAALTTNPFYAVEVERAALGAGA